MVIARLWLRFMNGAIILSNHDNLNRLLGSKRNDSEADPRQKLGLLADDIAQLQQLTEDELTLHRGIKLDDELTATVYHTSETNVDVFVFEARRGVRIWICS